MTSLVGVIGDRVEFGSEAVVAAAGHPGQIVVNGIVGSAGLRATVAALEAGNRVALANKESLGGGGTGGHGCRPGPWGDGDPGRQRALGVAPMSRW